MKGDDWLQPPGQHTADGRGDRDRLIATRRIQLFIVMSCKRRGFTLPRHTTAEPGTLHIGLCTRCANSVRLRVCHIRDLRESV